MNSLGTPVFFSVGQSFWKLRGRHCPHRSLPSPTQKKIQPPCSFVVSLGFQMDDSTVGEPPSIVDAPSSTADEPNNTHECTTFVKVDASLLRFIVGKGGKTKKQIEKDTTTHLKIPSPRDAKRGKFLVVEGTSQANVDDAVSQIHHVLEEAAESPSLDYSHFISLPLALHSDLMVQVSKFHDSVMALFPAKDKSIETSGLALEKLTNHNEETEDFESEQFDGNHDEEMEVFETGQVADLGRTFEIRNQEVAACEHEQGADLGETFTEKSTNLNEEAEGSTSKQAGTDTLLNDLTEQRKEKDGDFGASKVLEEDAEIPRVPRKGHGIEESIFIKPATLHITVLMLKLWNKERVAAALDVLQGLKLKLLEALDNQPVSVRLKGLECMKGSPAKAHVLYARVEDADQKNRLLNACKVIKDAFVEAGLVSEKDKAQQFKLHATLMNTSYRKRRPGKRFGRRIPFDARPILSLHGTEEWGEYTITEAHLSERFAYDEDGYYHCCGSVKFPISSSLSI